MRSLTRAALGLATVLCAGVAQMPMAAAMTVGEFRQAYVALHVLDPMTAEQRTTYIAAHRSDIDVARTRLEAATMVRQTVLRLNELAVQQGIHPFMCNYDAEDADEMDLSAYVDEFRSEALDRFKLVAGPKADKVLDDVEFDDVVTHKMLEKYPCPVNMPAQAKAAEHVHQHSTAH